MDINNFNHLTVYVNQAMPGQFFPQPPLGLIRTVSLLLMLGVT